MTINLKSLFLAKPAITSSRLIIAVTVFVTLFANATFFSHVLEVYPASLKNFAFLASITWVFAGITVLLLSLVCHRYTIKPILITVLCLSSLAAYFMDSYNVVIDATMIHNVMSTDASEALDLLSFKLVLYFVLLGCLPSFAVYRSKVVFDSLPGEIVARLRLFGGALLVIFTTVLLLSNFYSSFFREYKWVRMYANPGGYIYSVSKYAHEQVKSHASVLRHIALDAKLPTDDPHRELVIFVVGETARADRFSLNNYERDTNPKLRKENVVSFSNFWSCGTSTAVSVPCMFSIYNSSEFDNNKGKSTDNALDILQRAGVNVLWIDNNSNSKGVADRISYISYRHSDLNPVCDVECRDEGMLAKLQTYIDEHKKGDIFIVLHQMGNHGPAYYKRYPASFSRFAPVCSTNRLEDCSKEEIGNAYDNAILYTDYFLSKIIELLKKNDGDFESAMFYVSDHGESLGENGLYLHGLPSMIAPEVQRHVPAILWLGDHFIDADRNVLARQRDTKYTHDNIFHTILGFMEIQTTVYDETMDILASSRQHNRRLISARAKTGTN